MKVESVPVEFTLLPNGILYALENSLHDEPFGLVIGSLDVAVAVARSRGCYKVISITTEPAAWEQYGFKNHGVALALPFNSDVEGAEFPAGKKFSLRKGGLEVARTYVYFLQDEYQGPVSFIEDVFVDEAFRGRGNANAVVDAAIAAARERTNKVVLTTRHEKKDVQNWYKRKGFEEAGLEVRLDL